MAAQGLVGLSELEIPDTVAVLSGAPAAISAIGRAAALAGSRRRRKGPLLRSRPSG